MAEAKLPERASAIACASVDHHRPLKRFVPKILDRITEGRKNEEASGVVNAGRKNRWLPSVQHFVTSSS